MKRYIKFSVVKLLVFLCFIVLSLACASAPFSKAPEFNVSYEYESENPSVSISVEPNWDTRKGGISYFTCIFTNNTNNYSKVVWEESGVYYGNRSYLPFIDGQNYADYNKPMSSSIIPKRSFILRELYSSDQVYYVTGKYGGWRMRTIMDNSIQIIFQIETDKGKEYVTVNVSYQKEE